MTDINDGQLGLASYINIPKSLIDAENSRRRIEPKIDPRRDQAIDSTNYLADFQQANLASEFSKKLLLRMNQFDDDLDDDQEVGVRLVSFGQTITIHVSDVGYYDPSLILFIGLTDGGNRVELVQHVSQTSFLLFAVPKLNPEQPKRKIGFIQKED